MSQFYKQKVGVALLLSQSDTTVASIVDVQTNAQLELPEHSILLKTTWSAVVPLSSDCSDATVQLVLCNPDNQHIHASPVYTLQDINQSQTCDTSVYYDQDKTTYKCPVLLLQSTCKVKGAVKIIFSYI